MNPDVHASIDVLREFVAAIEYTVNVGVADDPVWGDLADALARWMGIDATRSPSTGDPLRAVLVELLGSTPEVGAPGGQRIGAIIEAALTDWINAVSVERNDGHRFTSERGSLLPEPVGEGLLGRLG